VSRATLLFVLVAVAATPALVFAFSSDDQRSQPRAAVRLGFESGDLSEYDSVQRAADDRLRVVRRPRRDGRYAARFEVRGGDVQAATTGIRAELIAERDRGRKTMAGDERWYAWSTLFARDYAISDQWQTFVQWKNDGTGSPPLAMTVQGDEIRFTGGSQNGFERFWRGPIERGHWHDFVAHVRWSPHPGRGLVELWHDGRRVVSRTPAATMYKDDRGRPIPNYLKIGLYRSSAIDAPQVLYHDALRVGASRAAVEEPGSR
jgi:Polysaccharide lyase